MAATPSTRVEPPQREVLLDLAERAIEERLAGHAAAQPPGLANLPTSLALAGASFVSLYTADGLRGCCGTLEPVRALAHDVWRNAQASAFGDPRFAPLTSNEWPDVTDLEIAVLSGFERVEVRSEDELLRRLRPHVDGLVLSWRGQRATFLPKVWERLHEPREFVARLKEKAGWPAGFWPPDMDVLIYRTETFQRCPA